MLSATVDQNPTIPVSDGTKNLKNSPLVWNLLGAPNTGPRPPAWLVTHHSSSTATVSMNGALMLSKDLIVSIPRQTTYMLSAQNAKKQIHRLASQRPAAGHAIATIV